MKPKLTLVGAGPGDIELITVKGLKALKTAKVILYDALVNPELLTFAPADAICINVGKRKGYHYYSQDEINNLIIEHGNSYGQVLRLKGGDSFVFGRGFEEIAYAKSYGFDTEVIPGLSSSIAVPAAVGIPLTHRSINQSFCVITGHTSNGQLPAELQIMAKTNSTIVILMGMSKLAEICEIFENARGENYPIAIIQNGTSENQKMAIGNLKEIQRKVQLENIQNPAIIVIGEVVNLSSNSQILDPFFENEFLQISDLLV
jgi:uroporphyrin-III C-methyltransferase